MLSVITRQISSFILKAKTCAGVLSKRRSMLPFIEVRLNWGHTGQPPIR